MKVRAVRFIVLDVMSCICYYQNIGPKLHLENPQVVRDLMEDFLIRWSVMQAKLLSAMWLGLEVCTAL